MAHPENWILATPDWSDAAAITASHEQAATPAANLQRYQPSDLWSATNLTPYLELDRGSPQLWNLVLPLFTNAQAFDTFRVRAATSQANLTAAPSFDSGQSLRVTSGVSYGAQTGAAISSATTGWTLEARFRFRTTLSGWITRKAGTGDLGLYFDGGASKVYAMNSFATILASPAAAVVPDTFRWYHVAVVASASELRLYVDGTQVATLAHSTTFAGDTIEAGGTVSPNSANVDLDWIRFWNVERTHEQLLANRSTHISSGTGLVCSYGFNGVATNSGTLGGSMTYTGSPPYRHTERAWASGGLEALEDTHGILWHPTGSLQRWLRIDFDWSANTQGLIRVGRLYVSNAHQFERNPLYGAQIQGYRNATRSDDLPGGQRVLTPSSPVPTFRLPFTFDSYSELLKFMAVVRTRGSHGDVAVVMNPLESDAHRHEGIGYGTLQSDVAPIVPGYEQYRSEVILHGLV